MFLVPMEVSSASRDSKKAPRELVLRLQGKLQKELALTQALRKTLSSCAVSATAVRYNERIANICVQDAKQNDASAQLWPQSPTTIYIHGEQNPCPRLIPTSRKVVINENELSAADLISWREKSSIALFRDLGISYNDLSPWNSQFWGEVLLKPTKIYVDSLLPITPQVKGIAHITGGSLVDNIPRITNYMIY
ncbi:unnamed protein product [Onchocerca ochengi]|uniref:phosphoribosylformylglycinamidine cyclo-ligase n=1 Tax=Onchocerca ochengi TaxID=42157 RepID=A0A182E3V0_ONCOC|nr:unnamed protein product [Onchocerca ochengi]